jgi:hypothetical protein
MEAHKDMLRASGYAVPASSAAASTVCIFLFCFLQLSGWPAMQTGAP